jgi:D-alanyl-D-alanine endopeptidase (penicillin-binding protein 7)
MLTAIMRTRRHAAPCALLALLVVFGPALAHAGAPQHASNHRHRAPAAATHAPAEPQLRSSSALVLDASTQSVLYARKADEAVPIASITKLMTSLVVLEAHQPMDEMLLIGPEEQQATRGNRSHLAIGTHLTRAEAMHLALMASENRAAHALGRSYPGGLPALVAAMNAKAQALGMSHTHFVEPTGLSSDNVASPQDLTRLVMAASREPLLRSYSTDEKYSLRSGRRTVQFVNTDALVRNPAWDISLQKTGYISEGGKCLVMKTVIEGRDVIIVLLDSFGKYTRLADARRVRQWMESTQAWRSLLASNG